MTIYHALRLTPGADLRGALETWFAPLGGASGAIVTCVGSLREASVRFADAEITSTIEGPLEIVSLVGTLSRDGVHLHVAVADRAGRMLGGHVKHGCLVYTTAEGVVATFPGTEFRRELDASTGYAELVVRRV